MLQRLDSSRRITRLQGSDTPGLEKGRPHVARALWHEIGGLMVQGHCLSVGQPHGMQGAQGGGDGRSGTSLQCVSPLELLCPLEGVGLCLV